MEEKAVQNIRKFEAYEDMLSKADKLFKYAKSMVSFVEHCDVCFFKYNDKFTETEISHVPHHVDVQVCINKPSLILRVVYINTDKFMKSMDYKEEFNLEMSYEIAKKFADTLKDNLINFLEDRTVFIKDVDIKNNNFEFAFKIKGEE